VGTKKLSITLPEELAVTVKELANQEHMSVSAWLSHSAEAAVRRAAAREAVRAFEAEAGPLTAEELAEAAAILKAGDDYLLGVDERAS
jgi:predicted transcriptional regulator